MTEAHEETEEQRRERLSKVHAAHTLNNTAIEVFVCLRIPEGKLTPEDAKVLSERHYVSVESLMPLDVVEVTKYALRELQSNVVNELNRQVQRALARGQTSDGDAQAEADPAAE